MKINGIRIRSEYIVSMISTLVINPINIVWILLFIFGPSELSRFTLLLSALLISIMLVSNRIISIIEIRKDRLSFIKILRYTRDNIIETSDILSDINLNLTNKILTITRGTEESIQIPLSILYDYEVVNGKLLRRSRS